MGKFKIGVLTNCLRLAPEEGLRKAAELGADGVQVYATGGEVSPEMDSSARNAFKALCADLGLELAALCGDLGGGFRNPERNAQNVERTKRIMDLAADLGTNVITTHIGVVPEDSSDEGYKVMLGAVREMAQHGAAAGVTFAVETGPEKATTLKRLLDDVGSRGVGVNLDPANLVMVVADDPAAAVHTLADYIVHTHAKDGVKLGAAKAGDVYGGEKLHEEGPGFKELPLGEGGVDWDAYLKALSDVGYDGFLTIEREAGEDPVADVAAAIEFLRGKIR